MEREGKEMNAEELAVKMTAEELAVKMEMGNYDWADEAAAKLRQQQAEIEALKETRCVACGWNPNLIRGERNDSGFYMSDAEHYKLKCESQQAEIEALKEELKRYADAIGEERGNKALRKHEIAEILTKVLDDCGLIKKASEK